MYLTSIVSFFIDQSEKWIVSSFYNLIVKLPKNEKLNTWHCSLDFWRILSCKIPKYAHMSNQHSILFDGLVRLNYDYMELIIAWWKPVDSLTGLVRFHVIRNLPANASRFLKCVDYLGSYTSQRWIIAIKIPLWKASFEILSWNFDWKTCEIGFWSSGF